MDETDRPHVPPGAPEQLAPRTLTLLTRHVPPPAPLYIERDDVLFLTVRVNNGAPVVQFAGRFLLPDGRVVPIAEQIVGVADRVDRTRTLALGEGWLLSLAAFTTTLDVGPGECYVTARIRRSSDAAAINVASLIAGYVTGDGVIGWPASAPAGPATGQGLVTTGLGPVPAAGAEATASFAANARHQAVSVTVTLTCGVAVATRVPSIVLFGGAVALTRSFTPLSLTASQVGVLSWHVGGIAASLTGSFGQGALPYPCVLSPFLGAPTLETLTIGLQAADQYTAIRVVAQEWMSQ